MNRAHTGLCTGILIAVMGWLAVGAAISIDGLFLLFVGGFWLMFIGSIICLNVYAVLYDTRLRRLFGRISEIEDPPLVEWKKDLEARGAFEEGDA